MTEIIGNIGRSVEGLRVVFEIDSRYDRQTLWQAISDRDVLAKWLGKFSHELVLGAQFTVEYLNDTDYEISGVVREHKPLHSLAYDWNFGEYRTAHVRFDLAEGKDNGTAVRLIVSSLDTHDVVRAAATWHAQLEFLRLFLAGELVPAYALRFRRDELLKTYAEQVSALGSHPENTEIVEPTHPKSQNPVVALLHRKSHLG